MMSVVASIVSRCRLVSITQSSRAAAAEHQFSVKYFIFIIIQYKYVNNSINSSRRAEMEAGQQTTGQTYTQTLFPQSHPATTIRAENTHTPHHQHNATKYLLSKNIARALLLSSSSTAALNELKRTASAQSGIVKKERKKKCSKNQKRSYFLYMVFINELP